MPGVNLGTSALLGHMGWDYDARSGDASYHLTLSWGGELSRALDAFGAFDWEVEPPEPPPSVWVERDDEDPWPFEAALNADELAYYGFSSVEPGKVPGLKLMDNSLWLVSPEEAEFLADLIDLHRADDEVLEEIAPEYPETLATVLSEFSEFCRAASTQGGFWAY